MTIGEKIKARREELGISVIQLAKIIGLRRQSIYDIEKNINNPRKPSLYYICVALNLNPETIEPIELPKRSAWDEFPTDYLINECNAHWEWLDKYVDELKQIRAKD